MPGLVECVPNFSEGRDVAVIDAITQAMTRAGATPLDVDMGAAANRTVVTVAGTIEAIEEAAFQGIRTAAERIDMSRHHGEHPRMGATDVCPFVPVSGVTMADCVAMARRVGQRVATELQIPVYLYEDAATCPERRSLADLRKGEYEALPAKMADPAWRPDFGDALFNPRSGATVIGAREFLIAYNVNLNTRDKALATRIAIRLRESGGGARGPDGERLLDPSGSPVQIPGLFRNVRAVGWTIEEYGIAQVSINLTNFRLTPMHEVYEEARRIAESIGVSVTGSEIVGLVPKGALLDAGRFYLDRAGRCPGASDRELIHIAVRSLGLSDVKPFVPEDKVIELRLRQGQRTLVDLSTQDFVDQVGADSAVPGGGSVSALCGSLGAALAAMVANLTVKRPEFAHLRRDMNNLAVRAQAIKDRLLILVVEDSAAFDGVMAAMRLPKATPDEKAARDQAIEAANRHAASVPLQVLGLCREVASLASRAAADGFESCLSDAGVSAAAALAGACGAHLNVLINAKALKDREVAAGLCKEANDLIDATRTQVDAVLAGIRQRMM